MDMRLFIGISLLGTASAASHTLISKSTIQLYDEQGRMCAIVMSNGQLNTNCDLEMTTTSNIVSKITMQGADVSNAFQLPESSPANPPPTHPPRGPPSDPPTSPPTNPPVSPPKAPPSTPPLPGMPPKEPPLQPPSPNHPPSPTPPHPPSPSAPPVCTLSQADTACVPADGYNHRWPPGDFSYSRFTTIDECAEYMFGYMRRADITATIPLSYNRYPTGGRIQYSCHSCWYSSDTLDNYMWRTNKYVSSTTANVYRCMVTPAPPPPPPNPPPDPSPPPPDLPPPLPISPPPTPPTPPTPPPPPPSYSWRTWCSNCQQPYSSTLYKTGYGSTSCKQYAIDNGRVYAAVRWYASRYYCVVGNNCCSGGSGYTVYQKLLSG